MTPESHITACDTYLGERTGKYEWRCERYDHALDAMIAEGLAGEHTVIDVGAGWTEFGCRLYERCCPVGVRPRYFPIDGGLDGTDLENWWPPRPAEFFVALELLEHLENPAELVSVMQGNCTRAVVISTPNPRTTDVIGMDRTHKTPIHAYDLRSWGFKVSEESFYGQKSDSLFGIWTP